MNQLASWALSLATTSSDNHNQLKSNMSTFVIPQDFGYVCVVPGIWLERRVSDGAYRLAIGLGYSTLLPLWQTSVVSKYRKAAKIEYPQVRFRHIAIRSM